MNMSHLIKNLYIINGPMGVGKTTVSQGLLNSLDHCVFLDGEWCWDMHPFIVNNETKINLKIDKEYEDHLWTTSL